MINNTLCTRWGAEIQQAAQRDDFIPLPEYPRPQMVRKQYQILNGWWKYTILPEGGDPAMDLGRAVDRAEPGPAPSAAPAAPEQTGSGRPSGRILVPFSPETVLSGVGRVLQPGETLRCERSLEIPEIPAGRRLLLHFGAVDQRCVVRVNGSFAGSHTGGYMAFSFDITDLLRVGTNRLSVDVRDDSDTSFHARGKQKLAPGGMFYQAQSGIWKTVWCEWVPERHIRTLRFETEPDCSGVEMVLQMAEPAATSEAAQAAAAEAAAADAASAAAAAQTAAAGSGATAHADRTPPCREETCLVTFRDTEGTEHTLRFASSGNGLQRFHLPVPSPRLWSPEDPYLYPVRVTVGADTVESYFAVRTIELSAEGSNPRRILLNGRPYFMHGVLDQGYWPESLMTPPGDQALVWDIEACKELGFNMLRKHVKVESARFYYHCDRLGMLVWQDAVNGGRSYNANLVTNLPNILPAVQSRIGDTSDRDMRRLGRQDRQGRDEYWRELREMVEEVRSHPCVCVWVPFNEGWGQFDSASAAAALQKWDPGRLVDAASGWFDRGAGDLYSVHNYFRKLRIPAAQAQKRAAALTEYGGLSRPVEGLTAANGMKAYRSLNTEKSLTDAYVKLVRRDILPQLAAGLCAAVYTQLSDVEGEINGLFTYDRSLCKMDRAAVKEARGEIRAAWGKICAAEDAACAAQTVAVNQPVEDAVDSPASAAVSEDLRRDI